MLKFVFLVIAFLVAVVGGAVGASLDDAAMMLTYMAPGLVGIIGLMWIYRAGSPVAAN